MAETLPDSTFANLLSAIGNSEVKSNLIRILPTNTLVTDHDLQVAFTASQSKPLGWRTKKSGLVNHIEHSLVPNGIAIEIDSSDNLLFTRTVLGERLALPMSGLLLDYSSHNDLALRSYFGVFAAPGEQYSAGSSMLRYRVLRELVYGDPIKNDSDLSKRLKIPEPILGYHLVDLGAQRVITYRATKQGQEYSQFSWLGTLTQPVSVYNTDKLLTRHVADVLKTDLDHQWTISEISEKLRGTGVSNGSYTRICNILNFLEQQNLAKKGKFSKEVQSELSLTAEQGNRLEKLLSLLEGFRLQDGNVVDRGYELALNLSRNTLSDILAKARRFSGQAHKTTDTQASNPFLEIIANFPGITTSEVSKMILADYDKPITVQGVRVALRRLQRRGQLVGTAEKTVKHWEIPISERMSK